jgi:hypothetical protein
MRKLLLLATTLLSISFAQVEVQLQVPTITVSAELSISLVPNIVVVEQVPEPQGIVVVYTANDALALFNYHDTDLRSRGWEQVKYEMKKDGYKAEYRRAGAKAKLEVKDKHGQIEVKLKEGE